MRSVSAELAEAIEAADRVVSPVLSVDWDGDGHGGSGTIDDLSTRAGGLSVRHVLVGDTPDEARVVEGEGRAELRVDLVRGDTDDERQHAARYFSRHNTTSPLYDKERLGRDTTCSVRFLTTDGPQDVPLFAGHTRAMTVDAGERTASLDALDYRERLRTKVTLPAVLGEQPYDGVTFPQSPGLESTWVVSYVLAQCGIYVSPPPRAGCRSWTAMHGSAFPHLADMVLGVGIAYTDPGDGELRPIQYQWGPYLLATEDAPDGGSILASHASTRTGPRIFDSDGHTRGRIELWSTTPSGSLWRVTLRAQQHGNNGQAEFALSPLGQLTLTITHNGVDTGIVGPSVTPGSDYVPLGVWWDSATGQVRWRVAGVTTTGSFTPPSPIAGPSVEDTERFDVQIEAFDGVSVADVQVTAGTTSSDLWLDEADWTPGAIIDRGQNRLMGIVDSNTQDAYTLLAELAAAEYGAAWFDADGIYQYASAARLTTTQAQTVQRAVTSATEILDLATDDRIDTVRNVVSCPYRPVVLQRDAVAWELAEVIYIGPGASVDIWTELAGPSVGGYSVDFPDVAAAGGGGPESLPVEGLPVQLGDLWVTLQERTSATVARLTVLNRSSSRVGLVDSDGRPSMIIRVDWLEQIEGDAAPEWRNESSISEFGEQPLALPSNPWRQRRDHAEGIAMHTCTMLARPRQTITDLVIPGDPRIEFYDRLRVVDEGGTEMDRTIWVTGRDHMFGDGYTMRLTGRETADLHIVGETPVGDGSLVGA